MSNQIVRLWSEAATRSLFRYKLPPEVPVKWSFTAGLPDPRTFPLDDLAALSTRILRTEAAEALQYGSPIDQGLVFGCPPLRELIAARSHFPPQWDAGVQNVMLTSGGVQAITLVLDAFVEPGEVVAVETPTWSMALSAVRQKGAELVAIPLEDDGMVLDVLEEQLVELARRGKRLKVVYTIATFHTPTGVSLSVEKRRRLLELASEWDFVIIEDNVYGDLRYDGEPIPSMLGMDVHGRVVKVDSFSKTIAPALRIGWVTGHADLLCALASVRRDLGVNEWMARTLAAFVAEGHLDPHVARAVDLYRRKRDVTVAAMSEHCADLARWAAPAGGFFLWVEIDPDVDGKAAKKTARREGIASKPGERFFGDEDAGKQFLRIAFSQVPIEEIEPGIAVLGNAFRAASLL